MKQPEMQNLSTTWMGKFYTQNIKESKRSLNSPKKSKSKKSRKEKQTLNIKFKLEQKKSSNAMFKHSESMDTEPVEQLNINVGETGIPLGTIISVGDQSQKNELIMTNKGW